MSQVSCGETLDFILWSYKIYKHSNSFQVLEEVQLEIPDGFGIISELFRHVGRLYCFFCLLFTVFHTIMHDILLEHNSYICLEGVQGLVRTLVIM